MQALNLYPHCPQDVVAQLAQRPDAMPETADVVIIGGGIMGLASAYYLSQRGLDVVVTEKDKIASQQSGRNWGFVRSLYRDPAELPLAMLAMSLWPQLDNELNFHTGWRRSGCLFMARDDQERAVFEQWCEQAKDIVPDAGMLSAREVAAVFPALAANASDGLYNHGDGQAEPVLATSAFARAAESNGVRILEDSGGVEIDVANGSVSGVLTEHGYIRAATVVCAAGAFSHRLLRKLGLSLPQQVVRSTVSLTTPVAHFNAPCFCGHGLGLRQRPDGSCIIAAESAVDVDVTLDVFRGAKYFVPSFLAHKSTFSLSLGRPFINELGQRLGNEAARSTIEPRRPYIAPNRKRVRDNTAIFKRLFDAQGAAGISKSWAGHVDVLPDALPVIDTPDEVSGLLVATGFSGHGFGIGPGVGRVVADLVAGVDAEIDISAFRLNRFRLNTYKRPHAPL